MIRVILNTSFASAVACPYSMYETCKLRIRGVLSLVLDKLSFDYTADGMAYLGVSLFKVISLKPRFTIINYRIPTYTILVTAIMSFKR